MAGHGRATRWPWDPDGSPEEIAHLRESGGGTNRDEEGDVVLSDISTFRRDGRVRADERPIEVVVRFTDAFAAGRLKALPPLLAPDCVDANAGQTQLPGRDGVLAKCGSFHARFAGFQIRLARVVDEGDGRIVAELSTKFPSGVVARWRGRFQVEGGVITRIEIEGMR